MDARWGRREAIVPAACGGAASRAGAPRYGIRSDLGDGDEVNAAHSSTFHDGSWHIDDRVSGVA